MTRTRLCALLLALSAFPCCASPVPDATAEVTAVVGRFAPAVHLEWLDGSPATGLESLRGRVVLLEFWRTWCGPCRQQVDHLNQLHERFEADGLITIGVSNEAADVLRTAAGELDIRYALARTEGMQAEGPYGIRSVPRAFLVDRAGVLVWAGHPATLETERLRSLLSRR